MQSKRVHKKKSPPRQRWPTPEELWRYTTPIEFCVQASVYAALPKFKRWLREQLQAAEKSPKSREQQLLDKYGVPQVYNDFDGKHELDRSATIYRYDYRHFLTETELASGDFSDLTPLRTALVFL